jgi:RNA polymerase sigma factor (sigma-70 family)
MERIDFNQLYTMYSRRLHYIAYSILKDHFLAEDVVQESFLKAFKKKESMNDFNKIAAWLSQITARTAIDFLRNEKRKNCLPSDQSIIEAHLYDSVNQHQTEEEVERRLFEKDLDDSMGKLSKEYKEVLVLKIHYGLKEKEIAIKLQLKPTTIKNRLFRARKQLQEVLSEKNSA